MVNRAFLQSRKQQISRYAERLFFMVLAFLLAAPSVFGQIPRPRILTMDNGLPSASVYSVMQDQDGFVWLGMLGHICRYDGSNILEYNEGVPLPYGAVNILVQMDDGTIVAGFVEAGLYRLESSGWQQWETPWSSDGQRVFCALKDSRGTLWAGTHDGAWFFQDGNWTSWHDTRGLERDWIEAIEEDKSGRIWIGGKNRVFTLEGGNYSESVLLDPTEKPRITAIGFDNSQNVYIGSTVGLFRKTPKGEIKKEELPLSTEPFMTGILNDTAGNLWITTLQGLLYRSDGRWKLVGPDQGLVSVRLWYPYKDESGNIWIPTQSHGIAIFPPPAFKTLPPFRKTRENQVTGLRSDEHWGLIAGYGGYLALWNGVRWNELPFPDSVYQSEYVLTFNRTSPDALVIAGPPLLVRLQNDGTMTDLIKTYRLPEFAYHTPMPDSYGNTWIPTYQDGIIRLGDKGWTQYLKKDGLPSDRIIAATRLRNGNLLLGSDAGHIIGVEATEQGPVFREELNLSSTILDLHEAENGDIWIGTANRGLYRWSANQLTSVPYGSPSKSNMTKLILTYEDLLVVGTSNGLYLRKDGIWRTYTKTDGLPSNYFTNGAGLVDRSGMIYLGTIDGLCNVDLSQLDALRQPPPARILQLTTGKRKVQGSDSISVAPGTRMITIEFTAINYMNPANVIFRYRILPEDQSWNETSSRLISFRNLAPGTYRFDVQSRLPGGEWGEADRVTIQVQATIWDRKWFQLLCIAGAVLAIIWLFKKIKRGLRTLLARHQKTWFSHYRLKRVLGQGGFATVYEAFNTRTKEKVALKVIHEGVVSDERVETFLQEGLVSASLEDPNVIRILNHGTWNHRAFLECELVSGVSLQQLIERNGALPLNTGTAVFRCLLNIVSRIHEQDIVHRDLNARNIMIADPGLPDNGRSVAKQIEDVHDRIKILDFGLARFISSATRTQLETEAGTPAYLPPEFFFEHRKVNPAVDVYSLGILYYLLVTGELPYDMPENGSVYESIASVLYKDPVPVQHHVPTIPEKLAELIMGMIQKDASRRISNIDEIRKVLDDPPLSL